MHNNYSHYPYNLWGGNSTKIKWEGPKPERMFINVAQRPGRSACQAKDIGGTPRQSARSIMNDHKIIDTSSFNRVDWCNVGHVTSYLSRLRVVWGFLKPESPPPARILDRTIRNPIPSFRVHIRLRFVLVRKNVCVKSQGICKVPSGWLSMHTNLRKFGFPCSCFTQGRTAI